jgi:hypothetical protein
MPYVLNGITLKQGKGFTIADGTQFPPNWLRLSTDQEKHSKTTNKRPIISTICKCSLGNSRWWYYSNF